MPASGHNASADSKKRKSRDRDSLTQSAKRAKTNQQSGVEEGELSIPIDHGPGERTITEGADRDEHSKISNKSQKRRDARRRAKKEQKPTQPQSQKLPPKLPDEENETSSKLEKALKRKALPKQRKSSQRETISKQKTALKIVESSARSLSTISGGRFIHHDPIFVSNSNGEDFLISATNLEVQVLALETSLVICRHHTVGLGSIHCFAVTPQHDGVVYIGYEDGTVEHWHWETGEVQSTLKMDHSGRLQAMQAVYTPEKQVVLCTLLRTAHHSTIYVDGHHIYKVGGKLRDLQLYGNLDYIAAYEPDRLVIGIRKTHADTNRLRNSSFVWLELPISSKLTCMGARLIQPAGSEGKIGQDISGLSLAIGNDQGQILLYDDVSVLFNKEGLGRSPSPRVLHWHKHAVASVKFSEDGVYLVSGGKESVLVLWQLNTSQKSFLPHLTSAIERIVVNPRGDRYALQMGDNSIMVLSTGELKPVANFAGLQMFPSVERSRFGGSMTLHPTQSSRLLLTVPPTDPETSLGASDRPFLQTFDIRTCRHLTRQALTRNNVTDFDTGPEGTIIHSPDVAHIAISRDGQWLASVDEWMPPASDLRHLVADEDFTEEELRKRREVYLKLWRWDQEQNLWSLVTRVDAPHSRSAKGSTGGIEALGAGQILALASNPATNEFATIGEDLCVKIWRPRTRTRHGVVLQDRQSRDLVEWVHRRTIQLPRDPARDEISDDGDEDSIIGRAHLAYSGDGSILAVAVAASEDEDQMEHILDPSSGELLRAHAGLADDEIFALGFLERYLIVVSVSGTYVWNMITANLEHKIEHSGNVAKSDHPRLAINHDDKTFAQSLPATRKRKTRVEVYDPAKPAPLHTEEFDTRIAAILAGSNVRGYELLFDDATICHVSSASAASVAALLNEKVEVTVDVTAEAEVMDGDHQTPDVEMTDLAVGSIREMNDESAEDDRPVVRPEQLSNIFDVGPSFAMPPVKDMFQAVVKLFSRQPLAPPRQPYAQAV